MLKNNRESFFYWMYTCRGVIENLILTIKEAVVHYIKRNIQESNFQAHKKFSVLLICGLSSSASQPIILAVLECNV